MAQLKYKAAFAQHEELYEDYDGNGTLIQGGDNDVMAYMVTDDLEVVFRGDDFNLWDTLNPGRLESITFRSEDGQVTATIKGLKVEVADLYTSFASQPTDIQAIVEAVLSGKDDIVGTSKGEALYGYGAGDRIKAGGGHDEIHGGTGKDRLSGGKGSDDFIFDLRDGKDVIADFDASGGGRKQDHIVIEEMSDVTIINKGQDTLIRYGDGSEILLEGVHKSEVKMDVDIVFAL